MEYMQWAFCNDNFYIYGAGIVAASIYTAVKALYGCRPKAFIVSDLESNPAQIDGIAVVRLSETIVRDCMESNVGILIAVPEPHHAEIAERLYRLGILGQRLVFVDNLLNNEWMGRFYDSLREFDTVSELFATGEKRNIRVFQAVCHRDHPLEKVGELPDYLCPLQVGAALTDEIISDVRDNIGENISAKNSNYCELTGIYFIWRNYKADYKGLCHYRRIFDMSNSKLQGLLGRADSPDIILPYPSVYYPNMDKEHSRYVGDGEWTAMLEALKEYAPDYYKAYVENISKEPYFYNFNMLIARETVFDEYCSFLFSVLERTEELIASGGGRCANRFAGYLGENLTTLYFRKNRDKLKIVHTGVLWLT